MKGNKNVLDKLNGLLVEELTAINQYMVHAEMCEDWGYKGLHQHAWKRSIAEMKHAEKLIERILFLEGTPVVTQLNKITIGAEIPKQFDLDVHLEYDAVRQYNEAIKVCVDSADNATKELLESILKDEDGHVNDLEALQTQVEQMGLPVFLTTQVEKS